MSRCWRCRSWRLQEGDQGVCLRQTARRAVEGAGVRSFADGVQALLSLGSQPGQEPAGSLAQRLRDPALHVLTAWNASCPEWEAPRAGR